MYYVFFADVTHCYPVHLKKPYIFVFSEQKLSSDAISDSHSEVTNYATIFTDRRRNLFVDIALGVCLRSIGALLFCKECWSR